MTASHAPIPPAVRRGQFAIYGIFLVHGIVVANWLARIPAVKESLQLSVSTLGLCLLGTAFGALAAMSVTPKLARAYGSRRTTAVASLIFCIAVCAPALAVDAVTLTAALFVHGFTAGLMDVAMNTQAAELETLAKRPIMSSFHALFSVGGLLGSATGGAAAEAAIAPIRHLAVIAAAMLLLTLWLIRRMLEIPPQIDAPQADASAGNAPSRRFTLHPSLIPLGAISFCALLGEGAMADWTAVYLRTVIETSPGLAAGGYAAFSLTMAIFRFAGDRLRARFGSVRVLRLGALLSSLGMAMAALALDPSFALIGFGLAGAGFATIFPIALSAAGTGQAVAPSTGIATVAGFGYCGFVIGPPIIGLIAEASSLRVSFGFVVVLGLVIVFLARAVRSPATAAAS